MGRDYYAVLEINRSATVADINRYRRLALVSHPLASPAAAADASDSFSRLAEAYDVLSNPQTKAIYDKFGEEGLKGGVPKDTEAGTWTSGYTYHGNPNKTFSQFFGGDNPFADGAEMNTAHGGLWGGRKKKQGAPIERDLFLDLEDLFHGCAKKIKISRKVMNEDGHTSSIRDTILTVNVKPGWTEGTKIIFSQQGDQEPNSVPADIVFVVRQKSHPRFERQNNDLIYTVHTSLKKALTGFSVNVGNTRWQILNIPIMIPNYRKVVTGEGMANCQLSTFKRKPDPSV
uniref:J domain-containing protein n=1 Tax=Denticeps clupeoides TaxID=299321 RepID=A0AAY4BS79_9TELE